MTTRKKSDEYLTRSSDFRRGFPRADSRSLQESGTGENDERAGKGERRRNDVFF